MNARQAGKRNFGNVHDGKPEWAEICLKPTSAKIIFPILPTGLPLLF